MTVVITVVLLFGAAIGIGLGLGRFKVLALLPAIVIVVVGAIWSGVAAGLGFSFTTFAVLLGVVSLQVGYLASFLALGFIVAKHLRVRTLPGFNHRTATAQPRPPKGLRSTDTIRAG
jgi:hypothetical protein